MKLARPGKPAVVLAAGLLYAALLAGCSSANPPGDVGAYPAETAIEQPIVATPEAPQLEPFDQMLADAHVTPEQLAALPRPAINTVLPAGLQAATPADLQAQAALPLFELTPAFAAPGDGTPVLALENYSNLVIEPIEARWTVVGQQPGWVRVMVPVGRGAMPSDDAAAVNHQAVWIPSAAVSLEPETHRIVVSISDRTMRVYDGAQEVAAFHVGIGIEGRTDTPLGVCTIIARVVIQTGAESLLTSCQSEQLDGFAGADWATIAVHEGEGFPLSQGGAVSNGCIRVNSADFLTYLDQLQIGTPVVIVP